MEIDRIETRGTIFLSPPSVNEQPPWNNSSVNNEHLLIIASHCRNMRIISYVEGQLSSLNRNSQISTQHWMSRNLFIFGPMLIGTFLLILGWGIPRKSLWHGYWNTLYILNLWCTETQIYKKKHQCFFEYNQTISPILLHTDHIPFYSSTRLLVHFYKPFAFTPISLPHRLIHLYFPLNSAVSPCAHLFTPIPTQIHSFWCLFTMSSEYAV